MPEPVFMKFGMYIMAPEPLSTAYFINPSHQSVSICVSFPSILGNGSVYTFPLQRIHVTIKDLLDASFSMPSVSYQRRLRGSVYPHIVARQLFGKQVPATTKNSCRRRLLCGPRRIKESKQ
jgi:hypothetical protein